MKCPRCLNEDDSFFYKGSKGYYCRKCISFGRALIEEDQQKIISYSYSNQAEEYVLKYPLTPLQYEVSSLCEQYIKQGDVLIHAVCGAGKTEIVMATIASNLKQHKKVCFAIPRRQVVLEVQERLQNYFGHAKVIAVCGGHTDVLDGDIIICTTHQLYRYYHMFDVLILDEPDAFPFRGNTVLHGIARTSCIGHIVYLTATPDSYLMDRIKKKTIQLLKLNTRPHGKPLPVPRIVIGPKVLLYCLLMKWLNRHTGRPRMIFVPTIQLANIIYRLLKHFFEVFICTSKEENRDSIMQQFKKQAKDVMVCTTVLERGITIPKADVCVLYANHHVFDEAGLIQIAGRAGRDFNDPYGDVLFLCDKKSEVVKRCKNNIEEANQSCIV